MLFRTDYYHLNRSDSISDKSSDFSRGENRRSSGYELTDIESDSMFENSSGGDIAQSGTSVFAHLDLDDIEEFKPNMALNELDSFPPLPSQQSYPFPTLNHGYLSPGDIYLYYPHDGSYRLCEQIMISRANSPIHASYNEYTPIKAYIPVLPIEDGYLQLPNYQDNYCNDSGFGTLPSSPIEKMEDIGFPDFNSARAETSFRYPENTCQEEGDSISIVGKLNDSPPFRSSYDQSKNTATDIPGLCLGESKPKKQAKKRNKKRSKGGTSSSNAIYQSPSKLVLNDNIEAQRCSNRTDLRCEDEIEIILTDELAESLIDPHKEMVKLEINVTAHDYCASTNKDISEATLVGICPIENTVSDNKCADYDVDNVSNHSCVDKSDDWILVKRDGKEPFKIRSRNEEASFHVETSSNTKRADSVDDMWYRDVITYENSGSEFRCKNADELACNNDSATNNVEIDEIFPSIQPETYAYYDKEDLDEAFSRNPLEDSSSNNLESDLTVPFINHQQKTKKTKRSSRKKSSKALSDIDHRVIICDAQVEASSHIRAETDESVIVKELGWGMMRGSLHFGNQFMGKYVPPERTNGE